MRPPNLLGFSMTSTRCCLKEMVSPRWIVLCQSQSLPAWKPWTPGRPKRRRQPRRRYRGTWAAR